VLGAAPFGKDMLSCLLELDSKETLEFTRSLLSLSPITIILRNPFLRSATAFHIKQMIKRPHAMTCSPPFDGSNVNLSQALNATQCHHTLQMQQSLVVISDVKIISS